MNKNIEIKNRKKYIEQLQLKNISLNTGMALWMALTILTLVTIILPIIFFRFYRNYRKEKLSNQEKIIDLTKEVEVLGT